MALHVNENYIVLPLPTSWILHINSLNCLDFFFFKYIHSFMLLCPSHLYECYYIQESKDSSEVSYTSKKMSTDCSTIIHFSLHTRNSAFTLAVCFFGWYNLNQSLQHVTLSRQSVHNILINDTNHHWSLSRIVERFFLVFQKLQHFSLHCQE